MGRWVSPCRALHCRRTRGPPRQGLSKEVNGFEYYGKPFYACRFRDLRRTVTYMAWADGKHFEDCETKWHEGRFYKLRATYGQHER